VVGRNPDRARETAASLPGQGHAGFGADVADPAAVSDLVRSAEEEVGPIAILVNNAGVTRDNLLMRLKDDEWDDVMDTNLRGAFHTMRAVSRGMMKRRAGRIINITSVIGIIGNKGQANYAASKAGLIGLTKSAAKELGSRGVLVNAVAPGYIETDMTAGLPEERAGGAAVADPAGTARSAGGHRSAGAVPGRAGGGIHHWPGVAGRRRNGHVATRDRERRGIHHLIQGAV